MSDYQVIARKFRPQTFKHVMGQEAIVTTLKNAIRFNRIAQAYLFCGSRGTGKTTLARLLAKALNCQQLTQDYEPCNQCSSCHEIASGTSLDVLEIDGASHRGIEDIRQINETVGYAASAGRYKIYIIDEVHMLTKEAFNALLKTLEEPPPKVKFLFATTEAHKVLPTILSRCQRFNLNRIPLSQIVLKLRNIAHQLKVEIEEDALTLLAQRAEGGLRDAESLFDQILAFTEGNITVQTVTTILGLMPRDIYFEIDQAGEEGRFVVAFEIAHRVFSEGKDLSYFIEGLIEHLRQILLIKISGNQSIFLTLSENEKFKYTQTAAFYSQEQCLDLIEYLLEAQNQLKTTLFTKISLETILLHVMRSHFRLSVEQLVRHISELEQIINEKIDSSQPDIIPSKIEQSQKEIPLVSLSEHKTSFPSSPSINPTLSSSNHSSVTPQKSFNTPSLPNKLLKKEVPETIALRTPEAPASFSMQATPSLFDAFISEDPTPTLADLGRSAQSVKDRTASSVLSTPKTLSKPVVAVMPPVSASLETLKRAAHEYDTLMHFAAVELDGRLQKH